MVYIKSGGQIETKQTVTMIFNFILGIDENWEQLVKCKERQKHKSGNNLKLCNIWLKIVFKKLILF